MGVYRQSRNLEASLVDFVSASLINGGWTGIGVLKGFPQDYKGKAPFIGVEALEIRPEKLEIGSSENIKYYNVKIRIVATNDGQRLDLSDFLFDLLEDDVNYYDYTIAGGVVSVKTLTGRIVITKWNENRKELQNTENLESEDRYRQVFTFECIVAL
jgi:hypothetical protein